MILLLLLCWTCLAHGGFPGRGPPPRGPPLLTHHPLAGGPPRSSLFSRRRPPTPHMPLSRRHFISSKSKPSTQSDLAVAAQTLYDLRGYQFPFSGPENPRFHRQNDPFTLPTPLAPNPRTNGVPHVQQDSRTAPLVFPSFYQEQPTPSPGRATIFGHNQHHSQTRFEPPGGHTSFHLGGNSASSKITLEQQSSSSRDQFRPSQIDISLQNNQVQSTSSPLSLAYPAPTNTPEKKSFLQASTSGTRAPVKLKKNQQDPFVYVYDEVDYDEGEDDFNLGGRRTPQHQINHNRITPATSTTTTAPLRSREPQLVVSPTPYRAHHLQQPQYHHQPQQALYSTSTTTKQPSTTQNSLFYSPQKDDFRDPAGIIRPPVTPRPNVEIVPSSERKPPPDQSNAIAPVLTRISNSPSRDYGRPVVPQPQVPLISDHLRRPALTTTTTTSAPPTIPHFQRDSILPNYHPPQGRQVTPSQPVSPIPYFPAGLDRRPFEANNEIPPSGQTRNNHFNQVVNLLQEEEEELPQTNAVGQALIDQGFSNPSKLRPVNTIIPKNRIPTEDIILPPNFHYTHAQDVTTTLSPINTDLGRGRGDPTQHRVRDQHVPTRGRDEGHRQQHHQRAPPTQTTVRSRPSVVFQEDEIDDNVINQPPSFQQPTNRVRGRQPTLRPQTTTTTTTAPAELPHRSRTLSPRQRLRANQRQTTTTTTTTTPAPTYVEYPSQEYLDDYENPPTAPPAQVQAPVVTGPPKSFSRFPPFPKKDPIPETTPAPRQQRPVPVQQARQQRPGKGNRFRETSTHDTATSPRTTGKPLYTTGKMLSKEGGLYAGQQIPASQVYGQPVVLERVPQSHAGHVFSQVTPRPSFTSPQKQLRSKQRTPEHGPPSRIATSSQRLRTNPTARPAPETNLDIVETVTLRPYQESRQKSAEDSKRLRPGSQFVRGQVQSQESGEQVLPRRRKLRPGQHRPHSTALPPDPYTETVSVHHTGRHADDSGQDRGQIIRESQETTTVVAPRSRRPRPGRLNKLHQSSPETSSDSERSRESEASPGDLQPKVVKAVRKLRPRLRPVVVGQSNPPQQQRSYSEGLAQSQSAQIERKPTDAPGRFSSRFREDNFDSTTASSLRGEADDTSSRSPSRFSPSATRPTFKPPVKKTVVRKRPAQQQHQQPSAESDGGDSLPESIKLSPKDVIANRKPARRIPPGSASDRLKALQQRRNKGFEEQTAEGRQVPVTKRPRLKANFATTSQTQQAEQEHKPRRPHQRPSAEAAGQKREIVETLPAHPGKIRNELDYFSNIPSLMEDFEDEDEDNEYANADTVLSTTASTSQSSRQHVGSAGSRPSSVRNHGFHRNRSVEVTSDEARSILGISRPASPNRLPKKSVQDAHEEDAEVEDEEEDEHGFEEKLFEPEQPHPRIRQNNSKQRLRESKEGRRQLIAQGSRQQISRERVRTTVPPPPADDNEEEEEDLDEQTSEYREETDKVEPPRKPFLKHQQQNRYASTTTLPTSTLKNQHRGQKVQTQFTEEDEAEEEEDDRQPATFTSTSTSSTTRSSSQQSSGRVSNVPPPQLPPVPLPQRPGPQPIKQGLLKARLRPNKVLAGGAKGGVQPRVSVTATTTEATITEEQSSEERKRPALKHGGTVRTLKITKPRLANSGGGGASEKRNSKKFISMATENPSLPLESIFPEVV